MANEKLVLLSFPVTTAQDKLRWEHAGEFEFNGQMYDVVKTEIRGDTIHYWCFWDKKETTLNTRIKDLVAKAAGNHPQNKENQKRLITFLQTLYFPGHFAWNPDKSNKERGYPSLDYLHCSPGFFKPSIPPPKIS